MQRNALLTLFILMMVGRTYAQQAYFVLIQADNSQPFYVRLDDKTLSSNSKGRLILAQLKEGRHSMAIGFPKQAYPEQQFSFDIGEKDLEFQLKDLGEKGWGLFNPQTLELKTADKKEGPAPHSEGIKKDDAFSRLMAGVVSDTAVMYNTFAMEEMLKGRPDTPLTSRAAVKTDTTAMTSAPVPDTLAKTAVIIPDTSVKYDTAIVYLHPSTQKSTLAIAPRQIGTVVKLSERKTPKGLRQAFADRPLGKKADTVIIYIPMDTVLSTAKTNPPPPGEVAKSDTPHTAAPTIPLVTTEPVKSKPDTSNTAVSNDPVSEYKSDTLHIYTGPVKKAVTPDSSHNTSTPTTSGEAARTKSDSPHITAVFATPRKLDSTHIASSNSHTTPGALYRPKPDSSQKKNETKPVVVNSDCRNFASDYDVDKLRVKMLDLGKDEDRILLAKKVFKTKCFTTRQIKALSEVFTTDAVKYRFFETAYPFVSDDRFRDLTDLLADPVYNGKFRALTGQQ